MPTLSVIIVNYNVRYFLEQALTSVFKAAEKVDTEVWVVDNNSVDDSVDMVRERFPQVKLIANTDNPGFAIANNQAIRQSTSKYVLLLNPDTVVEEDTFEKCVAFMDAHPDAGGLGVRMIDGQGLFLPESKRGFPSLWVAFTKTTGLSSLFKKSKRFNQYHLGYLDEFKNHEVDVLSGAFMMMRKEALDKVGLLDETFFMYGEDIDLSYRIVQGGFKNYYCSDTTIIHYKGESTKKGSLNYVKTFYQAMIIFAQKHFTGASGKLYVRFLRLAIYLRAALTLLINFFKRVWLPLLDAIVIFGGMYFLKNFWATTYHNSLEYYTPTFMTLNVPLYIAIWLIGVYFSGGYDRDKTLYKIIRGLAIGTVVLAAVYGFLNADYRPSRMLILLGAVFSVAALCTIRVVLNLIQHGSPLVDTKQQSNVVIVGDQHEANRVQDLLYRVEAPLNVIGVVAPSDVTDRKIYLGSLQQLDEIVNIYRINEVIFCARDITSQNIMQWMTRLGGSIDFKIVPEDSISIIGSNSKNSAGDLYTIDIRYAIREVQHKRNKRLLDVVFCLSALFFIFPIILFQKNPLGFLQNLLLVLVGKKSWVGYHQEKQLELPNIKSGVLSPDVGLQNKSMNIETIKRLNFHYAKDYSIERDLEIIRKGWRLLGS